MCDDSGCLRQIGLDSHGSRHSSFSCSLYFFWKQLVLTLKGYVLWSLLVAVVQLFKLICVWISVMILQFLKHWNFLGKSASFRLYIRACPFLCMSVCLCVYFIIVCTGHKVKENKKCKKLLIDFDICRLKASYRKFITLTHFLKVKRVKCY